MDDYKEFDTMLSKDNEEVKEIKDEAKEDLARLIGNIRYYNVSYPNNNVNINDNFEQYQIEDSFIRYNIDNEIIDYKIDLLRRYLSDLELERGFNEYRLEQEQKLSKEDYLNYLNNPVVKGEKITIWYNEFKKK